MLVLWVDARWARFPPITTPPHHLSSSHERRAVRLRVDVLPRGASRTVGRDTNVRKKICHQLWHFIAPDNSLAANKPSNALKPSILRPAIPLPQTHRYTVASLGGNDALSTAAPWAADGEGECACVRGAGRQLAAVWRLGRTPGTWLVTTPSPEVTARQEVVSR